MSFTMSPAEQAKVLIESFSIIKNNIRAKAVMKKGVIDNFSFKTYPFLRNTLYQMDTTLDNTKYLTLTRYLSAFYAFHPFHTVKVKNFGTSIRRFIRLKEGELPEDYIDTYWRHFDRIFSATSHSQRCKCIYTLIRQFIVFNVPVNYEQLFIDLVYWNSKTKNKIKQDWANEFMFIPETKDIAKKDMEDEDVSN